MPPPKFRRPAPPVANEGNDKDDDADDDAFFTRNTRGWSGVDTTVDSASLKPHSSTLRELTKKFSIFSGLNPFILTQRMFYQRVIDASILRVYTTQMDENTC
jgi:hypothetical protein